MGDFWKWVHVLCHAWLGAASVIRATLVIRSTLLIREFVYEMVGLSVLSCVGNVAVSVSTYAGPHDSHRYILQQFVIIVNILATLSVPLEDTECYWTPIASYCLAVACFSFYILEDILLCLHKKKERVKAIKRARWYEIQKLTGTVLSSEQQPLVGSGECGF